MIDNALSGEYNVICIFVFIFPEKLSRRRGEALKKLGYYLYFIGGSLGLLLLFLLNFCYLFIAAGLTALGIIAFPSVLLGIIGFLTVITDLGTLPLLLISGGALLLGGGLCLGTVTVCPASLSLLHRFRVSLGYRKERVYNE